MASMRENGFRSLVKLCLSHSHAGLCDRINLFYKLVLELVFCTYEECKKWVGWSGYWTWKSSYDDSYIKNRAAVFRFYWMCKKWLGSQKDKYY